MHHNPLPRIAEPRDVGAACPHCSQLIESSDRVVACPKCGAVHHEACWLEQDGCGTYDCAPVRRVLADGQQPEIRISASELDGASPLPKPIPPRTGAVAAMAYSPRPGVATPGTLNRLAVASAIVAFAGIVLAGFVTGVVAMIMAAFALGQIQKSGQRGTAWGVVGILLGMADTVGWIVLLAFLFSSGTHSVSLDDFEMDPATLENVQPSIARAMRANVLITVSPSPISQAIGSGVIVRQQPGETLIVTNRHVVDPAFHDRDGSKDLPTTQVTVAAIGQIPVAGRVVWIAPDGLDLAVVSAPLHSSEAAPVRWSDDPRPAMGDEVFSIGNPQGLGWSHTQGTISQLRTRRYGARRITIIQTDTAINPGNSGGGLYDESGNLIGINTWTSDKQMSEGLSFAISFASLLQLDPPFVPEL